MASKVSFSHGLHGFPDVLLETVEISLPFFKLVPVVRVLFGTGQQTIHVAQRVDAGIPQQSLLRNLHCLPADPLASRLVDCNLNN